MLIILELCAVFGRKPRFQRGSDFRKNRIKVRKNPEEIVRLGH
ncbi:MAG TPA: hypothetical protein VE641_06915 [Chthoniobacterales bacterium]|nr:hypothetical protein [Chthoniobacterales bacterium]